tara:strand:+ start:806 stop:952 length:147 start_codon:yes stop_codon:yes gene_type:complete
VADFFCWLFYFLLAEAEDFVNEVRSFLKEKIMPMQNNGLYWQWFASKF